MKSALRASLNVCASVSAVLLAACGGGSTSSVSTGVAAPVTGPVLSGTAATGMALSGATVNAKCRTGTGAATTAADGSFSMSIAAGVLPCVLEISNPADGKKIHSIAINAGVINLTPLTELLSTRLLRTDMAAVFANPDASAIEKAVTTNTIKQAQDEVSLALASYVDTSKLSDFYSTPLKPATASNPAGGDAQDKLLDSLKSKMTAQQNIQVLDLLVKAASVGQALGNVDAGFTPTLALSPPNATVAVKGTLSFAAMTNYPANVMYIRQPVKWTVQEAAGGSISMSGEYTAPDKAGVYHVQVQREDFPALSATATVTVSNVSTPVFMPYLTVEAKSVSVKAGSQYFFKANINYPPNIYYIRQPVSWSLVEANAGTIDIMGSYLATDKPGTYHVRAQRDDFPEVFSIVEVIVN